jgi:hypothetical protein
MKYDNIIAIVPNIYQFGVAFLKTSTRQLEVTSLKFPLLLDYLFHVKQINENLKESLIVIVKMEGLNKENISKGNDLNKEIKKVFNAEQIYEAGMKIIEICNDYDIKVIKHQNVSNGTKEKNGRISQEKLHELTGLMGKTNQKAREAALLAWTYAGF